MSIERQSYHWPTETTERVVGVGDVVEYVDPRGRSHNALVTAVWSPGDGSSPSLNLVYVSDNVEAEDPYGRQLAERATSITHMLKQAAPGFFWRERQTIPAR